ncbi:hypothetical protein ACIRPU_13095 [Streptomyces sp. NPDC102259]|uniref:hypothetical protein n=1 Tax=Streptomyces sp. NPDC102259 TaxID=3366148 RepID=UPI00381908B2
MRRPGPEQPTPTLTVWSVDVRARLWRFEQAPDWSVLYAELALAPLGGTAAGLALWAVFARLADRRLRGSR